MSFWRTFGFHTVSAVETLLDKDDFTLQELLEEEEILQEVKSQNKRLLDYLTRPEILRVLVEYITVEADEEADSKRRFKYPFLACEILCSEVWSLCDAIYDDRALLDMLFGFLRQEGPLSHLHASYVCRAAGVLMQRKITETIEYMKETNLIEDFIRHLSNASVMDLLLKVISCEDTAEGAGILDWLCETDLIPCLVRKFDPEMGEDVHENASQALVDIVAVSGNVANSPLMQQLQSSAIVESLFGSILAQGASSSLLHGLTVATELVLQNAAEAYDADLPLEELPPLLKVAVSKLESLLQLVRAENSVRRPVSLLMDSGELEPFGFHKLKVVEFFAAVARTNYGCVDTELRRLDFFTTVMQCFFKFTWNNFLHATVEHIMVGVFESDNVAHKLALLRDTDLLDVIVAGDKRNAEAQSALRGCRLGFMGHLTSIAAHLAATADESEEIASVLAAHTAWTEYADGSLRESRERDARPLGGQRPMGGPGESSDDEEEEDQDGDSIFDRYQLGFSADQYNNSDADADAAALNEDDGDERDPEGQAEEEDAAGMSAGLGLVGNENEDSDAAAAAPATAAADDGDDDEVLDEVVVHDEKQDEEKKDGGAADATAVAEKESSEGGDATGATDGSSSSMSEAAAESMSTDSAPVSSQSPTSSAATNSDPVEATANADEDSPMPAASASGADATSAEAGGAATAPDESAPSTAADPVEDSSSPSPSNSKENVEKSEVDAEGDTVVTDAEKQSAAGDTDAPSSSDKAEK